MVILVFLHLFLAVPALAAPEVPQSFKSLHHIPVSGGFANIYVDKAKVRIVNKPVNRNDSDDILVWTAHRYAKTKTHLLISDSDD